MNILPAFQQVQGPLTETKASGMLPAILSVLVITPFMPALIPSAAGGGSRGRP